MLRFIIEDPPEDAESKRTFKYVTLTRAKYFLVLRCFLGELLFLVSDKLLLFSRFPFIACEIFTCEIDVILKTLVEEEEVGFIFIIALCFDQEFGVANLLY